MKAHIFREYDIRGVVDEDLTDDVVTLLGKALGTQVVRAGGQQVVVGRDCRLSGVRFREAFLRGLLSTGIHAVDVGVVPTPLVYFAAHTLPVDGLAMITGSHNPPNYNGFKVGVGKSTLYGEGILELRRLIERGDFVTATPGRVDTYDIVTPYVQFVRQTVKVGPKKLKVVVDAGNGVGGAVAVPMLQAMGYDVVPLFCEMDGRFPNHHADPTVAENLQALIEKVASSKADVGIAYDGDADRIGVVDETGAILWGDRLMIVLSRAVLKEMPKATIVGEVKCSQTMYDDISRHGGHPVMWKAGHSLIKAKMKETHAALAGEMSGHIFYRHRFFGFDDAPYTTARLLEILSSETRPLSRLLDDVPDMASTPELRVKTTEEEKFPLVQACLEQVKKLGLPYVDVDGVRVQFPEGWGLIRASNTTPILVLRAEAGTADQLAKIRNAIEQMVETARAQLRK